MKKGVLLCCALGLGMALGAQEIASAPAGAKHQLRLDQQRTLLENTAASWGHGYLQFKQDLADETGLQYGVDVSFLPQRGAPSGKKTNIQAYYYPYLTWNLFQNTAAGSGQLNVNYNFIRYWGGEAVGLQDRLGLLSAPNDYPANQEIFSQLSYTHTLPGEWDWLSATVGQFPLYNFDGAAYLNNQQTALLNYAMSQNASSTYPTASFGGYVQAAFDEWSLAGGWQDATNISGQNIRLNKAFKGKYTWFGSLSYNPQVPGLGEGQYSFLYYYQPATAKQDAISRGWSVNASQHLSERWVLSARANGSDGHMSTIKNSYVLATSLLDPLSRHSGDVITLGVAYNRADRAALGYPPSVRKYETALELQWVWSVGKLLTITPDVQFYPKAGLSGGHKFTTVASLRTTVML